MAAGSYIWRLVYQASRRYHAPTVATTSWKADDVTIRLYNDISSCSAYRPARAVGIEQAVRVDDEIAHLGGGGQEVHRVPWIKPQAEFMQTRRGGRAAGRSARHGGRNRRQSARHARCAGHCSAVAGRRNR